MIELWPYASPRVVERYEAVVEAIEARTEPFTRNDLIHELRDYSGVAVVVNELRRFGLIEQVSPRFLRPQRFRVTPPIAP